MKNYRVIKMKKEILVTYRGNNEDSLGYSVTQEGDDLELFASNFASEWNLDKCHIMSLKDTESSVIIKVADKKLLELDYSRLAELFILLKLQSKLVRGFTEPSIYEIKELK